MFGMSQKLHIDMPLGKSKFSKEQNAKFAAIQTQGGLGYLHLDTLMENLGRLPKPVKIMPALCGANCRLQFDISQQQLLVEQGFSRAVLLPPLHRNVLPLKGSLKKSEYLFAGVTGDKFVAV